VTSTLRQLGATVDSNTVYSYKLCLQTGILNPDTACPLFSYHHSVHKTEVHKIKINDHPTVVVQSIAMCACATYKYIFGDNS